LAKALRYQSKCPHSPMHGLGLIDNHVEKLLPFASIHHSIHGGWKQMDEAPYPFRVKGKDHLPLFVFFYHYWWFWIHSLWNLVLFVIWILSLWNLVLFVIWILSLWNLVLFVIWILSLWNLVLFVIWIISLWNWLTPNSLKGSNVSPSKKQRKRRSRSTLPSSQHFEG